MTKYNLEIFITFTLNTLTIYSSYIKIKIMKIKVSLFISVFLCFCTLQSIGQIKEETYEEYQKREAENLKKYFADQTKAYEEYKSEEKAGMEKLRKEIEDFWGTNEFKTSSKKDWVEYSNDKKSRSNVDFENGTAEIEILVDADQAENSNLTNEKLKEQIEQLVQSKGKTKDYSTKSEKATDLSQEPVLQNQLETKSGEKVNSKNAAAFADELLKNNVKKEFVTGKDGKKRAKLSISMKLAPDYIRSRASKYESLIKKYAKEYDLPEELIYALIHTESYYNPKAKSHAPAYGLMQLVPKSGARDAYSYVYNTDKILTSNYLYNPEQNIELGTAYLSLLMLRHFSGITDINTRLLCTIASYNTGAGNLARAYTGKTNPKKALSKINKMSYEENYGYLRYKLPYEETRDYIKKVTQRMQKYKEWQEEK